MIEWGWVDFSSEDRARARNVLASVKDQGTLDELGIGQLRDLYSDLLFPGFSTIQTGARYFLAVPKILRDWAEEKPAKRGRKPLAAYLQQTEDELTRQLVGNYKALGLKPEGVIGHTVVDDGGVQRRPSSTYWNGLRTFGIVRTDRSLAEFCRQWGADSTFTQGVSADEGLDDELPSLSDVMRPPDANGAWPEGLTLALTKKEAAFLADRFMSGGLPQVAVASQLLRTRQLAAALPCADFSAFATWAAINARLDRHCRDVIDKARRFSLGIEGAHIIFNCVMARNLNHGPLKESAAFKWEQWHARCKDASVFHQQAAQEWASAAELGDRPIRLKCEDFLARWNQAMCEGWTLRRLEDLIENRALDTKKNRSLLRRTSSISGDGKWFGMEALNFRWGTARRMLKDINEASR